MSLSLQALTALLMFFFFFFRDSRTDGALQRQQDNERKGKKDLQGLQEEAEKERKEMRDEERGGGTVLTPACLFYLGAQHGYRCCAAPSHRDMTASLCSHTIPQTHTQTHTPSASRCCLAPLLLILFEHLSLSPAHLDTVWFHSDTHTHSFRNT